MLLSGFQNLFVAAIPSNNANTAGIPNNNTKIPNRNGSVGSTPCVIIACVIIVMMKSTWIAAPYPKDSPRACDLTPMLSRKAMRRKTRLSSQSAAGKMNAILVSRLGDCCTLYRTYIKAINASVRNISPITHVTRAAL